MDGGLSMNPFPGLEEIDPRPGMAVLCAAIRVPPNEVTRETLMILNRSVRTLDFVVVLSRVSR